MNEEPAGPPDEPISREDTLAIIGALADILVEVRLIRQALLGNDDEELEEDEP